MGKEVNTLQRFLAVAVLGVTLASIARAAFADDGRYEPEGHPTQKETMAAPMAAQDNSTQQSIYDTPGQAPDVHVDREAGHSK